MRGNSHISPHCESGGAQYESAWSRADQVTEFPEEDAHQCHGPKELSELHSRARDSQPRHKKGQWRRCNLSVAKLKWPLEEFLKAVPKQITSHIVKQSHKHVRRGGDTVPSRAQAVGVPRGGPVPPGYGPRCCPFWKLSHGPGGDAMPHRGQSSPGAMRPEAGERRPVTHWCLPCGLPGAWPPPECPPRGAGQPSLQNSGSHVVSLFLRSTRGTVEQHEALGQQGHGPWNHPGPR